MPANATQQTTKHSGGDNSISDSLRTNDQRQDTTQITSGAAKSTRSGSEERQTDITRAEHGTTTREAATGSTSERTQNTDGSNTQAQTSRDVTVVEKAQVIRRTTQSGGGQTNVALEDIGMTLSFELEIMSPL